MSQETRIAGAGLCALDHIVVSPHVDQGNTAWVSDYLVQGGGLVATAIVACARLGSRCELFSLVGDDSIAEHIIAELETEKVGVTQVQGIPSGDSAFSFIHVDEDSGERTIYYRPGAGLTWKPEDADLSLVAQCHVLLIDDVHPDLALAAAKTAQENSVPVVADLLEILDAGEILKYVDVLIAPSHFARDIGCEHNLDAALDRIHELGPSTALVTLGPEGCVYSDPTGRGRAEAFDVDVVDTTGAGDTFHGAYAYAVAQNWETPRCCLFAAAVAAMKCTKPGGRTGLPTLPQALEFLRQRSELDWPDP